MIHLVAHLNFFSMNSMPDNHWEEHPNYNEHVNGLNTCMLPSTINQNSSPDLLSRLKQLPHSVQKKLGSSFIKCNLFDYLSRDSQRDVFKSSENKPLIENLLLGFNGTKDSLKIKKNSLNSAQIVEMFNDIPKEVKSKLKYLDLSEIESLDGFDELHDLHHLETLILPANRAMENMTGFETVGSKLHTLSIKGTGVKSLGFLRHCHKLVTLDASDAGQLTDIIAGLRLCLTLKKIILPLNANISDAANEVLKRDFPELLVEYK